MCVEFYAVLEARVALDCNGMLMFRYGAGDWQRVGSQGGGLCAWQPPPRACSGPGMALMFFTLQ